MGQASRSDEETLGLQVDAELCGVGTWSDSAQRSLGAHATVPHYVSGGLPLERLGLWVGQTRVQMEALVLCSDVTPGKALHPLEPAFPHQNARLLTGSCSGEGKEAEKPQQGAWLPGNPEPERATVSLGFAHLLLFPAEQTPFQSVPDRGGRRLRGACRG